MYRIPVNRKDSQIRKESVLQERLRNSNMRKQLIIANGILPRTSTMELEDYKVDLRHVLALELTIDPDLGKNQAFAVLAEWRMA
jgi:hypothetical protein